MRLPASKIELAVSQEESRYTINAVQFDAEKKRFLATDGHIGAIIPASSVEPEDHSGLIATDTIKKLRAMQKPLKGGWLPVRMNGKVTAEAFGEKIEHKYVDGQFPNLDAVMPKFQGAPTVSLDAALLLRLAQALHESATPKTARVSIWIKDANSCVGVKIEDSPQAYGVIMPCRTRTGQNNKW